MGKWVSPKNELDTGVPVPGASKLDHLQPLYWGLPFLIAPFRGWKEAPPAGAENGKMGFTQN